MFGSFCSPRTRRSQSISTCLIKVVFSSLNSIVGFTTSRSVAQRVSGFPSIAFSAVNSVLASWFDAVAVAFSKWLTSGVSTKSLVTGFSAGLATGAASSFGVSASFGVASSLGTGVSAGFGATSPVFSGWASASVGFVSVGSVGFADSAFSIAAAISAGNLSKGWTCVTVPSVSTGPSVSAAWTIPAPKMLAPIMTEAAPIANLRIL